MNIIQSILEFFLGNKKSRSSNQKQQFGNNNREVESFENLRWERIELMQELEELEEKIEDHKKRIKEIKKRLRQIENLGEY